MADEWKDIDEEIKKLEEEFTGNDESLRYLAAPSAADYWKKRSEEEKNLHSKIVESKEEEKKLLETKLKQQKERINQLEEQIKNLNLSIAEESQAWQERLKTKETELILQKQKVDWDEEFKRAQYEKKILEEDVERLKNLNAKEQSDLKRKYETEMAELLSVQNELMDGLKTIENEMNWHKTDSEQKLGSLNEEKKKLAAELEKTRSERDSLRSDIDNLDKENKFLNENVSYLKAREERNRDIYFNYIDFIAGYFSSNIKNCLGTVAGVVSYCFTRTRLNRVARRQLSIITGASGAIVRETEKCRSLLSYKKPDTRVIFAERLLNRLTDNIDTSVLPGGLKLNADFQSLKKAVCPYIDASENVSIEYVHSDMERMMVLKIIMPYKIILNDDYVNFRNTMLMHGWEVSVKAENNKTGIYINIPVES